MKTHANKWGNSVAIRIPKPFATQIGIVEGSELEIQMIDNHIIVSKPQSSLESLLKKVTPKNIHSETDTGSIKGKEIW